ncbi:hypothetical protein N7988_28025 (plasmid) [Bacillus cereus]|uniref:hypothetical protein n=1 Tax=Bacillus cereus TaxID=1396 RepID=UPI0021CB7BB6|nr:hypothetical protein [Bacillus cereus]MCU7756878.1 hypothetical protein [Bacillus cereus]MDC7752517.1 hypothetical protein [Bacillus cereus]UXP17360.1 hypothetical protein N7988_28025 [Bacillus cereus]
MGTKNNKSEGSVFNRQIATHSIRILNAKASKEMESFLDPQHFAEEKANFDFPTEHHGDTENFHVYYNPELGSNGITLSDGVLSVCERDYNTIVSFFGGLSAGPFNIIISPGIQGAYHHSCSGTDIYCGVKTTPHLDIDFTRLVAVAEIVEVFSAVQNRGWDCGASNGEGLSRVLAAEIYPKALTGGLVTAPIWLDESDRPNYIDNNDPTDTNPISNGCSVLFLNYLHYQLGFSWSQIVQAGGSTLADTYRELTGNSDGFQRFKAFMDERYPVGNPSRLDKDNPFS